MRTSAKFAALIERYTLTPGIGVGPVQFGDRVADHPELELRDPEPEFVFNSGFDYAEYRIPGLEDVLLFYVDSEGCVALAGFSEFCHLDGRDLIGMGVGELLIVLGLPSAIEAEEIGYDVELLYVYDDLGLTLWTIDGEVCVVQARTTAQTTD